MLSFLKYVTGCLFWFELLMIMLVVTIGTVVVLCIWLHDLGHKTADDVYRFVMRKQSGNKSGGGPR